MSGSKHRAPVRVPASWHIGLRRRMGSGVFVLLALLACSLPASAGASRPHRDPLPVGPRMFDMGVADIDQDGRLDLFTTTHNNEATALLASGAGFTPAPPTLGFGQNLGFPGVEAVDRLPTFSAPGTYIYVHRWVKTAKELSLQIDAVDSPADVDLAFNPSRQVKDVEITGGTISPDGTGKATTGAHIHLDSGGTVRMRVNMDLPVRFHSTGTTFVGSDAVRASSPDFVVRLPDVHADVFADFNGDGTDDLFRVVGGLAGGIAQPRLRDRVRDITRFWGGRGYRDIGLALHKEDCRGRQGGALDINGDGLTDLFETCADANGGAPGEPFISYGEPGGGWDREVVPIPGTFYRWVPLPGSSLPALLVLTSRATLWQPADGGWQLIGKAKLRGEPKQVTVGDFDRDGRPDVYASSLLGSSVIQIRAHSMKSTAPKRLGLPGRSSAGAWVDADGDGKLDLDTVPGGLYRATNSGRFEETGKFAGGGAYAHLSWADFDNNGLREPVIARTDGEFTIKDHAWWYGLNPLRAKPKNPWLEVNAPGNWLTAKVTVTPNHGAPLVGWAGDAETARFSQGHNRTYFSLPPKATRATVSVTTTDGQTHTLETPVDRVVSAGP